MDGYKNLYLRVFNRLTDLKCEIERIQQDAEAVVMQKQEESDILMEEPSNKS